MGFAESFRALSDPVRREILLLLRKEKLPAGEIAGHFELTGAAISYHLNQLKKAGLVYEERYKNFIYYGLNTSVLEELLLWLGQFKEGSGDGADQSALLRSDVPASGAVPETEMRSKFMRIMALIFGQRNKKRIFNTARSG